MSARHKLNAAYGAGSLLLAALLGGAAQSGTVFVVALVALLSLDLVAGNIRRKGRSRITPPRRAGAGRRLFHLAFRSSPARLPHVCICSHTPRGRNAR
jgi:hypothetical protein